MKYFVAALLACLATTVVGISMYSFELNDWESFKVKHKKEYRSDVEENFRKRIFLENRMTVLEHNKLYYEGRVSYTKGLNQYSDMLSTEISSLINGLRQRPDEEKISGATFIAPSDEVQFPSEFDWRTKGAVTEVKNQGQCGSCWAFSAVGSLEGQHFLKTGKLVSLSEQNLVDCASTSGCEGGFMDFAFTYVRNNKGIDKEVFYPYTAKDGICKYNVSDKGATDIGYMDLPQYDENILMRALALFGPISVGIVANENFQAYQSGVYSDSDCTGYIDHGVLLVGYGHDDASGYDYWIVKNSWGSDWGEKGYIRMRRNFNNMCQISNMASYPLL